MERVYVGNLPPDIRIKDIDDFFRPFGKLVAIDVNNRSNPAFAFVQFDSQRNALSAVRNRHGYDYEGYTLQVKLVENNVGSFEVRNQSRQVTPPPPPPMFNNDFNNQSQMGGGFGNNNFGRNGGNFGGNNFGSNNFGSNNFGNDFNLSSSSSFQRNMPSQNMIQYPSKNVRSIMPAQNNMIEYPINKGWGSGGGGAGVSNRGGGGGFSNRGGRSDMGNDFNNMGGGYSFNPNNNCYADDNFEDRFTQGLSGSGRKWFNRYIQKGFAPKIAREKAIEHRTLPYLRDGPKSNQIANNAVANLPLPALENFGNKLISLFSGNGGGGGNFGGNANQMMPNFNNWGNNMQGGFSNDFNTAGPGSSNYRSGNRNTDRALMPRRGGGAAMNRNVKPNTAKGPESGILDKMLAEIPKGQRKKVAKEIYTKSLVFLKGPITTATDRFKKKYHKQIVQEYKTLTQFSSTNANETDNTLTVEELKNQYHEKKRELYGEAFSKPDYPNGILPEIAQYKLNKLLENGFYQPGATHLSKLSKLKINKFIQMKQMYEGAVRRSLKGVRQPVITKPKSDKEAAYQNNLTLLKKYEAESPITASNSLILACLKKIRQYETEMKLPLTKTKFDNLLPKVNKINAKVTKPHAKKVVNKVQTKDKQNENKVKENVEAKVKTPNEGKNQDSPETPDKPDDEHENDQENMETTEENDDQIVLNENPADKDNVVDLTENQENDEEEQNEKELLEED